MKNLFVSIVLMLIAATGFSQSRGEIVLMQAMSDQYGFDIQMQRDHYHFGRTLPGAILWDVVGVQGGGSIETEMDRIGGGILITVTPPQADGGMKPGKLKSIAGALDCDPDIIFFISYMGDEYDIAFSLY